MVLTLSEMAAKWRLSEPGKGLVTACSVCLPFFSLAGLLEPNTAASSSDTLDLPKEEGSDEVLTPTKPRTTEDLFAAIHPRTFLTVVSKYGSPGFQQLQSGDSLLSIKTATSQIQWFVTVTSSFCEDSLFIQLNS